MRYNTPLGRVGDGTMASDVTLTDARGTRTVKIAPRGIITRHPEPVGAPKPPWIRALLPSGPVYSELKRLVAELRLHTVCQEALCPNIGDELPQPGQP